MLGNFFRPYTCSAAGSSAKAGKGADGKGAGGKGADGKGRQTHRWPEAPPAIRGSGKYHGHEPRGAGIIAVCDYLGDIDIPHVDARGRHVCICESSRGNLSFPKGGLKAGEFLLQGAFREWQQETGISLCRLRLLQGESIDEPNIGTRYLVGICDAADTDCGRAEPEPDFELVEWRPPDEDPADARPITKCYWMPVVDILADRTGMSPHRIWCVRRALRMLETQRETGGLDLISPIDLMPAGKGLCQ